MEYHRDMEGVHRIVRDRLSRIFDPQSIYRTATYRSTTASAGFCAR
jgi:hypothetical protein